MRSNIYKLTLYFLGLLNRNVKKKEVGCHPGYTELPEFQVDQAGHPGFTGLIASLSLNHLKLSQDPRLPGF
jgi:hypothetical protein